MSDQTYTIAELLALPDDALNVLAAELRGWHAKYFIDGTGFWCGGGKILYEVVIGSLTHEDWPGGPQGITRPHWSPADDRNQSGELLEWLADQGFSVSIGRDRFTIVNVGISHSDYGRIGAHEKRWPRAETVAFCAAMLAMEGRLK